MQRMNAREIIGLEWYIDQHKKIPIVAAVGVKNRRGKRYIARTYESFFHNEITDDSLECPIRFNKLNKDNKKMAIKLADNQNDSIEKLCEY